MLVSIMDMLEYIPTIVSIGVALGTLLYVKRSMSTQNILIKLGDILTEITSNTDMQKKIYMVGGILGNGIRAGVGIGGKGGKFKMEDLIGGVLSKFLSSIGGGQQQEQTQQGDNPFG